MKSLESSDPVSLHTSPCQHVTGMTWKDIAQIMVSSHKNLCSDTGVKLVENIVKITVDQPLSEVDYVKTSVEVHIPGLAESENMIESSVDPEHMMKSDQGGVCDDNKMESNEFSNSLASTQTMLESEVSKEVYDAGSSPLKTSCERTTSQTQQAAILCRGENVPFDTRKSCSSKGDSESAMFKWWQ